MSEASKLFEESMEWLRQNYACFGFFVERDIVWTLQLHLSEVIQARALPYRVFNDYPILLGKRRGLCADIAILNQQDEVEVAAEVKYEPSHKRTDTWRTKFPVVFWDDLGVGKDVRRVREFAEKGVAHVAYAIFIDEGGAFRSRTPHAGSKWVDWTLAGDDLRRPSVLWTHAEAAAKAPSSLVEIRTVSNTKVYRCIISDLGLDTATGPHEIIPESLCDGSPWTA